MDRPPPCKFYQSGFCAKGDDCPFSHPIQRCRSFTQDGFCPYGVHCHYWHDFKNFALTASTNTPVQKVCRFFLNGQCNYGDACAYSHQLDDVEAPNQITLTEYRLQQQMAQLSAPNPLISVSPQSSTAQVLSSTNSSRLAVARPSARLEQAYRSALQPGDLEKMRDLEVDRLLKRFPPSQLKQTSCNNDGVRAFSLIFSSTDPEWLHKVKQILLFISLPAQYPSSPPILNVPKTSDIPNVVTAFPCCQRAFPCDNCHDEEVAGAHETLHATRIICGFCSTEQPEVTTSPMVVCSACQRNLTSAGATNHWEGGRGCRDPVKMSRKDNRKHRIRR
ncbi:hypothetical protein EGR_03762 [Echinococcus granulosus]|uniref:RING-type E3 ubiquitin transferase n=1 Tax=Echinococcus granulosus TaxID=6210 RepID=W6UT11_ECHGR|nr:hypothetical protein EGR_03762 [Echinococcus granulosus]EUB61472.1 hypothetical protein EGR_03762 [Echinococcus granulosus]